jgi:hypothetical protein
MTRVSTPAALSDIANVSEVQVSNPTIRVDHLRNGLAYVRVDDAIYAVPDTPDAVRLEIYRLLKIWRAIDPIRRGR